MDGDSLGTVADLNPLKTQLAEIFQKGSRQVTVESANSADFSDVLRVLRTVRDLGAKPLSLKVAGADGNFMVMIPISADADEDIVKLRPNPLTLVVRVAADHRLYLNGELQKSQPALLARLRQIFRQRKEMKVYRPGSNEIEATLFLKPYPDLSFAAVIELLGALHRVGADPLGLQVDDLGDGYTSVLRSGLPLGPKTDAFFNRVTKVKQQLPPGAACQEDPFSLADLNRDGKCDRKDLKLFRKVFAKCVRVGSSAMVAEVDFDLDGCVTQKDRQAFLGLWQSCKTQVRLVSNARIARFCPTSACGPESACLSSRGAASEVVARR